MYTKGDLKEYLKAMGLTGKETITCSFFNEIHRGSRRQGRYSA